MLLARRLVFGVAEDQAVALFEAVRFNPLHHFCEEGVYAGGNQHANGLGRIYFKTARYRVGRVVEFCHRLNHFLGRVFADPPSVVEHM